MGFRRGSDSYLWSLSMSSLPSELNVPVVFIDTSTSTSPIVKQVFLRNQPPVLHYFAITSINNNGLRLRLLLVRIWDRFLV